MSGQILSDACDAGSIHVDKRPCRNPVPTTKLLDKNNTERPVLPFQQKSIDNYRAAQDAQDVTTLTSDNKIPTTSCAATSQIVPHVTPSPSPPPTDRANDRAKDKRPISKVETFSDSDSAPAKSPKRPLKKKRM
jgi:hypothetical protein